MNSVESSTKSFLSEYTERFDTASFRYAFALLLIFGAVAVVFWSHISYQSLFIGNSDRLNTYLSMRLTEYDSLKTFGRAAAWSPHMFGGFSISALPWMNVGKDPIGYLLQLFPRQQLFEVLGYVAVVLVIGAGITAYLYIREVCASTGAAAVGAVAYALSVFSIHRIAQVDNAHLTIVLIPLVLLFIRRTRPDRLLFPFIGLCLTMTALAYWAFLQEVAYAFLFFGAYALYRAGLSLKTGRSAAFATVVVFGSASIIALLFAGPRLLSLSQEFLLLTRTDEFKSPGFLQILRLFHEGIYGRTYEEMLRLGNKLNVHEGLQLVSSTMLVLVVCFGMLQPRARFETAIALLLIGVIAAISTILVPLDPLSKFLLPYVSPPLLRIVLVAAILGAILIGTRLHSRWLEFRIGAQAPRPDDFAFHLLSFVLLLLLIVISEGAKIVYLLFGKIEFLHGRLSILIVLPLCTLFSVYLAGIMRDASRGKQARDLTIAKIAFGALVGGIVAYLIHGPLLDPLVSFDSFIFALQNGNRLLPIAAIKGAATIAIFILLVSAIVFRRQSGRKLLPAAFIAGFVFVESVAYAQFKIEGSLTRTYPVPFRNHNYLNVSTSTLRPPGKQALADFQNALEVEKYRTIEVNEFIEFPVMATAHVASFWRARSIGGYSTSPSWRLARLPWPAGVQSSRSLHFANTRHFSRQTFALLAALNVKYILIVTPELYFNIASFDRSVALTPQPLGGISPARRHLKAQDIPLHVVENPITPLPRHFFVERISDIASQVTSRPQERTNDGDARLARLFEAPERLRTHSFAEGVSDLPNLDVTGDLQATYGYDFIHVRMTPSEKPRFLVINELYHPAWHAFIGEKPVPVVPTNLFMRGVLIPPHTDHVNFGFAPFSSRWRALIMQAIAIIILIAGGCLLRYAQSKAAAAQGRH